ncbi:MAG: hypothetical protein WAN76_23540, partial [Candidatus Sulfotelmatobacter sp.]
GEVGSLPLFRSSDHTATSAHNRAIAIKIVLPYPVNEHWDCALKTKRIVVGQITICRCGNTDRGLPEVPVEWLKSEWRKGDC